MGPPLFTSQGLKLEVDFVIPGFESLICFLIKPKVFYYCSKLSRKVLRVELDFVFMAEWIAGVKLY